MPSPRPARLLGLLALGGYSLLRLTNIEWWDLLDYVNLAIHEAGHIVFLPFGDVMVALGGSLLQTLVPAIFVAYFLRARQRFAGAITMGWVGVNLIYVSRYISDARAQELPLLGGGNCIHDWWYVLISWDLLKSDLAIGRGVHLCAALVFVAAVVLGATDLSPQLDEADASPGQDASLLSRTP
jgi:hypothetical protein